MQSDWPATLHIKSNRGVNEAETLNIYLSSPGCHLYKSPANFPGSLLRQHQIHRMVPHVDSPTIDDNVERLPASPRPSMSANPPRILIIGAGSRGNSYARATGRSSNGVVTAVAEPIKYKRQRLGVTYIWGKAGSSEGQEFEDWRQFLTYEHDRRARDASGEDVPEGIDAVLICVLDEMHKEVIVGLAPLGLHIMCEKPLATSLDDCVSIYKSLLPNLPNTTPSKIFSIGHVLRYSPHNMLLRKLLLEDKVIGEIMSINHTEPVGWWHFTHSYVRYLSMNMFFQNINLTISGATGEKNPPPHPPSSPNPATTSTSSSGSSVPHPQIPPNQHTSPPPSPHPAPSNTSPKSANQPPPAPPQTASPAPSKNPANTPRRKSTSAPNTEVSQQETQPGPLTSWYLK